MKTNIVIGSGITGTIASLELLNDGNKVIMLDIGTKDQSLNENFQSDYKYKINKIKKIYKKINQNKDRKNGKYYNGSNYIFNSETLKNFKLIDNVFLPITDAKGGLANIWGANFCQPREEDLKDWPVKFKDLQIYFNQIYKYIPTNIELSNFKSFKQFSSLKNSYNSSYEDDATNILFNIFNKEKNLLNKENFFFNRSFLVVGNINSKNNGHEDIQNCQKCGFCMHKCPHDLIFNPQIYFSKLKKNKNFTYINNATVVSLKEVEDIVQTFYLKSGKEEKLDSDKIFMCSGPLQNLIILNNSGLINNEKSFELKDTQQFIFLSRLKKKVNNIELSYSTLSKINIHISNKFGINKTLNFQIYPYSEIFLQSFINIFGNIIIFLQSLLFSKLNSVLGIQGFLHSDFSNKIILKYDKKIKKFLVFEKKNFNLNNKIKEITKYFCNYFKQNNQVRFYSFPTKILKTGQSYHVGSIFPIKQEPEENECDLQGKLKNTKNIHILDSSILPDLPATSFTFLVLANAIRILRSLSKTN